MSVDVGADDIVLVTTGSQAADMSPGTMDATGPAPVSRTILGAVEDIGRQSTKVSAIRTLFLASRASPTCAG